MERELLQGSEARNLISEIAEGRIGMVAHWQLLEAGLGRRLIQARIASGELIPRKHGVYDVGHRVKSREATIMAAALGSGPQACVSHTTAAEVWGIRAHSRELHITRPSGGPRVSEVKFHRSQLSPRDMSVRHGFPVTSIPRTLLDSATILSTQQLEKAVLAAERQQVLDWTEMEDLIRRSAGRRGMAKLRMVIGSADPRNVRAEPGAEELFLLLWLRQDRPRPEINVRVGDYIVDFLWPLAKVIVECDGYAYHQGRLKFEEDRQRDMDLRAAGYEVHRLTYRMLKQSPEREIRRIHRSIIQRSRPNAI